MEANVKSILEMARGAIMERVDFEMPKIIENIMDPNTKATKARKLTLTLVLTPDDSRQMVALETSASASLVPYNPIRTNLYITAAADSIIFIYAGGRQVGLFDMGFLDAWYVSKQDGIGGARH